jgi:phosphoribosyl-ATP pyrophosphohydrolase/phosphoribosyl-AMP cyclohydrolase
MNEPSTSGIGTSAIGPGDIDGLAWAKSGGLLPAIAQHATTGDVLMLAWMNPDALRETFVRGRAVFHSRSRNALWEKGETSGNVLHLRGVHVDCDRDTLLLLVDPAGPACHTGMATCFGDRPLTTAAPLAFLGTLERVIAQRVAAGADGSYTAKLHASGLRRMAQKVGEEGLEVALAATGEPDAQLLGEAADLLFHLEVLLQARGLALADVVRELEARHRERTA